LCPQYGVTTSRLLRGLGVAGAPHDIIGGSQKAVMGIHSDTRGVWLMHDASSNQNCGPPVFSSHDLETGPMCHSLASLPLCARPGLSHLPNNHRWMGGSRRVPVSKPCRVRRAWPCPLSHSSVGQRHLASCILRILWESEGSQPGTIIACPADASSLPSVLAVVFAVGPAWANNRVFCVSPKQTLPATRNIVGGRRGRT
jgi:hypothetical protein